MEKKNKNIMIMVSETMHQKFLKACHNDEQTMSEHLRECIKNKIRKSEKKI